MTGAQELLQVWKNADAKDMANLQPRQSTGLGLLVNYMLDESAPVAQRWNTFAQYVQESQASNATLQMSVTSVLMTKNATADTAVNNWRWSTAQEQAAVTALSAHTGTSTFQAFQALGGYTLNGTVLPVKVGGQVAMAYLKAEPSAGGTAS